MVLMSEVERLQVTAIVDHSRNPKIDNSVHHDDFEMTKIRGCPERHSEMVMVIVLQRNPTLSGKVFQKRKSEKHLFSFQNNLTRPIQGRFRVPTLRIVSGLMNPLFILIYFFSAFAKFEILGSLFFSGPFSLVLFFACFLLASSGDEHGKGRGDYVQRDGG